MTKIYSKFLIKQVITLENCKLTLKPIRQTISKK